nr:uncharacterized protein LOC109168119 [Ipomoea batatas]
MTAAPPQPRRQLFSDHDNLQLISSKLGPSGGRGRRRRCGGGGFARKCAALVKEQRARNLKRFRSSEQVKTHLIRRGFKQGYDRWIWHGETVLPSTSTGDKRIDNNNLLTGAQQNIFKANDMTKDSKEKSKKAKEKHEGNVHPHHLGRAVGGVFRGVGWGVGGGQTGQELRKQTARGECNRSGINGCRAFLGPRFRARRALYKTAQWGSVSMWEFRISMVGIDSIAAFEAGGSSILPNPFASIWVN